MNLRLCRWFLCLGLASAGPAWAQNEPVIVDLWPGGRAPGDNSASIGPERQRFDIKNKDGTPYSRAGRPVKWITAVTHPTLTIYRPAPDKNNGAAVIVCPGGGYWNLAIDLEGEEAAQWLTTLGVTGIVLKYRVPRRPGNSEKRPSPEALADAQRAVSLVRSQAEEWGIDPHRIGMIGFSVGGNMVVVTATHFEKRRYEPVDAADEVSSRPDFGIGGYSGIHFGQNEGDDPSLAIAPNPDAPPIFLVHASDDSVAPAEISANAYLLLKRAGAPVELHIYETGEHGFGVRKTDNPATNWTETCANWMRHHGFLTPHEKTSAAK